MDRPDDFVILSRAIDALDRLYDGRSGAVDIEAILRVAGMAISDESLGAQMVSAADRLVKAMNSSRSGRLSAKDALNLTDVVRKPIAEAWSDLYT